MNRKLTLSLLAVAAVSPVSAAFSLQNYQLSAEYNLPAGQAAEASAIVYNRDRDSLFVVGDEGLFVAEVSKTGALIGSMTLTGFADTEGLAYVGGGRFLIAEERLQTGYLFTYAAGGTLTRSGLQSYQFGANNVGNVGLEGFTYDFASGKVWGVKEKTSQAVYEATLDLSGGGITVNTNPFNPAGLGLLDLSDIYAIGNSAAYAGTASGDNFLIVSQESNRLLEVSRTGQIVSSLDLASYGHIDIEGVTMDDQGNIYLTSEATPSMMVFSAPVPEPSVVMLGGLGVLALLRRRR